MPRSWVRRRRRSMNWQRRWRSARQCWCRARTLCRGVGRVLVGVRGNGDLALRLMEFALRVCPPEVALTPCPHLGAGGVRPVRRRAIVCAAAWPDAGLNAPRAPRPFVRQSFLISAAPVGLKVVTGPEIGGLRNGRLLISSTC